MKYTAVFAMVACAASATAAPSFQELNQEWQSLATNPDVQSVVKSATPLLQQFGVDSQVELSPAIVLNMVTAIDNSVVAFHQAVDNAGGRDTFQAGGDAVVSAYVSGLLGHLNVANVESAKMAAITTDAQAVFDKSVELIYVDLYNLIDSDISNKLVNDITSITGPALKIVADMKDILVALKDLVGGKHRALFEHMEAVADEMVRVLADEDLSMGTFICKFQPVINKVIALLSFVSSDQVQKDMQDLVKLLNDLPASNKVVAAFLKTSEAIYEFLQTYDPTINDTVLPVAHTMQHYIEGMCRPKARALRALADDSFDKINPMELISKAFDFVEKMIEQAISYLQHLPEPLSKDALQVIYDIIELVAPEKASYIKEITDDISDVTAEMAQLLPALNTTKADLNAFMLDSLKTMGDMKALAAEIVALLKAMIAKH